MNQVTVGIEQVVAAIDAWRGHRIDIEELRGGLTNANYAVTVEGQRMFVRVPGADTSVLAVDRLNELHNTRAAAETGIGAGVVQALPQYGAMVLEWIDGRTMSNEAFAEEGLPDRVAASLRRLHAGPTFLHDFDMFRLTERYLGVVDERGIPIPDGYRERLGQLPELEAALRARPLPSVPCHNDLLAENYLDDGERLRIVDYEYSGNGDPTFELGNTCQELGWDDRRIEALCAAYFGTPTAALLARMRLNMIMSDVGWTLWAAIQAHISTIAFDFWGWAEERWARAASGLDSDILASWLREARA
ncbi:MAG: choline/ethanolamine kinase family protein [Chloroflexota bacterium]